LDVKVVDTVPAELVDPLAGEKVVVKVEGITGAVRLKTMGTPWSTGLTVAVKDSPDPAVKGGVAVYVTFTALACPSMKESVEVWVAPLLYVTITVRAYTSTTPVVLSANSVVNPRLRYPVEPCARMLSPDVGLA
jgi:hypothetical protein